MPTILILATGCPARWLGAYGNEWVATPNLDRLAAEGTVFDRHITHAPDPVAFRRALPPGFTLRHARPTNYYAPPGEWFDVPPLAGAKSPMDALIAALPAELPELLILDIDRLLPPWEIPRDVFDVYLEELLDDADLDEPPEPWANPPTGWFDADDDASWELLHRSFAAAMTTFDADLGLLFDAFRAKGWHDTATWAFTSDYGFPLGQHGLLGPHRPWLYEEFVHLPLIVRRPGTPPGAREAGFTQPADLPAIFAGEVPVREFALSRLKLGDAEEVAIRTDRWAYLLPLSGDDDREPELYAKPDDQHEATDVRQHHPDAADELDAKLRAEAGQA